MKKVLIGTPIYEGHKIFLDGFLDSIKKLDGNLDLILSDNSESDEFFNFLKNKSLNVIKSKDMGNKYGNVLESRKGIVEYFLKNDYEYLFWVDSDILLPKNALLKLISDEKDIVSGLYISPFKYSRKLFALPVAYKLTHDENLRLPLQIPEIKEDIMEVHSVGFGCCLVKRDVVEKVQLRRIENTSSTEDVLFCFDAKKLNYRTYLDSSVLCKHGIINNGKAVYLYPEKK